VPLPKNQLKNEDKMNTSWTLFLDDVRDPPAKSDAILARSVKEAQALLTKHGAPQKIHFDHDLGDGTPTGYDFAKQLVDLDLDADGKYLPANFSFVVHSDNPPGAENIKGLLDGYLAFKGAKSHPRPF
jgi:hypothetical protein